MEKLVLNGIEIEYDFSDYTNIEKFEIAQEKAKKFSLSEDADMSLVERTKSALKMYKAIFSDLLGASVVDSIVQNPNSVAQYEDAFYDFLMYVMNQTDERNLMREKFANYKANPKRDKRRSNV